MLSFFSTCTSSFFGTSSSFAAALPSPLSRHSVCLLHPSSLCRLALLPSLTTLHRAHCHTRPRALSRDTAHTRIDTARRIAETLVSSSSSSSSSCRRFRCNLCRKERGCKGYRINALLTTTNVVARVHRAGKRVHNLNASAYRARVRKKKHGGSQATRCFCFLDLYASKIDYATRIFRIVTLLSLVPFYGETRGVSATRVV